MTDGACGVHTYINKSDGDFYGKTQALTVAFTSGLIEYYSHHTRELGRRTSFTAETLPGQALA